MGPFAIGRDFRDNPLPPPPSFPKRAQ